MRQSRLTWLVAICWVSMLGTGALAQVKYPVEVKEVSKQEGETTVWVSAKVSKQKDKGLIEAVLKVRKSGQLGKGYGYAQFVFLDKDGNTIHKSSVVDLETGAVFGKGTNTNEKKPNIDVPLDKLNEAQSIYVVLGVKDTGAFKDIEKEIEKEVKKVLDSIVNDIASGKVIKDLIPLK